MIIAIDGPAASGKGTIGRKLAKEFGLAFLDTGLLYRAATKRVIQRQISPFNLTEVINAIEGLQLDEANAEDLRTPLISSITPVVAQLPGVRDVLAGLQRKFARQPPNEMHGAVLDGRDIGTVICPDADCKLYITASLHARARRRYKELLANGIKTSFQTVHRDLRKRDEQDASRLVSPLIVAEGAVVLDTTDMSVEEAFRRALALVIEKLPKAARGGSATG